MHQIPAPLNHLKFHGRDQISVGFLLLPSFPMACLSSVQEPLRAANEVSGQEMFSWTLYSEDGTPVASSACLTFEADGALSNVGELELLFVLSEPDGTFLYPRATTGKLRHLYRHGTTLCAVSGGIFPLARSGILAGQTCSVHRLYRTAFEAMFPHVEITDDVISINHRCCTASRAASAFDLARHIINTALGDATMAEVACCFQHPAIRSPNIRQKTPTFSSDETADHLPQKCLSGDCTLLRESRFPTDDS